MLLTRTQDLELVRRVVLDPSVLPGVVDDGMDVAAWTPPAHGIYLKIGDLLGIFCLVPMSTATIEAHTMILPAGRGPLALDATRAAMQWVWDNTRFERIVTQVPDYNRAARMLAIKTGMTEYGYNPGSYLKGGKLMGIHLLGVSRCR